MYKLKTGLHRFTDGRGVIRAGVPGEDTFDGEVPKGLEDRVEEIDGSGVNVKSSNNIATDVVPDEFSAAVLEENGDTIGIWLDTVSDLKMIEHLREVEIANKNRSTVVAKFDKRIAALS